MCVFLYGVSVRMFSLGLHRLPMNFAFPNSPFFLNFLPFSVKPVSLEFT